MNFKELCVTLREAHVSLLALPNSSPRGLFAVLQLSIYLQSTIGAAA